MARVKRAVTARKRRRAPRPAGERTRHFGAAAERARDSRPLARPTQDQDAGPRHRLRTGGC